MGTSANQTSYEAHPGHSSKVPFFSLFCWFLKVLPTFVSSPFTKLFLWHSLSVPSVSYWILTVNNDVCVNKLFKWENSHCNLIKSNLGCAFSHEKKSRTSTLLLRDSAEDGSFFLWSKSLTSRLMSWLNPLPQLLAVLIFGLNLSRLHISPRSPCTASSPMLPSPKHTP